MDALIRFGAFCGIFTTMVLWELYRPRRPLTRPRQERWVINLSLPLEILLSLGCKAAVVVLLGPAPWTLVAFEVLLNAASVFNHSNVALPERLERWLRWGIVTPDMHRIHHSTQVIETNSNFGFAVSWWDRLCGTYRAQPACGQMGIALGLAEYRDPAQLHLG